MERIKITDDMQEQLAIGKELFESKPEIYDDYMVNYIRSAIDRRFLTRGGGGRSNERRLILSFNL